MCLKEISPLEFSRCIFYIPQSKAWYYLGYIFKNIPQEQSEPKSTTASTRSPLPTLSPASIRRHPGLRIQPLAANNSFQTAAGEPRLPEGSHHLSEDLLVAVSSESEDRSSLYSQRSHAERYNRLNSLQNLFSLI